MFIFRDDISQQNWDDIIATPSKEANDWRNFKNLLNIINNEIKQAKAYYYNDALNTNKDNSRITWRIINELLSKKSNNSSVKEIIHNSTPFVIQMSCQMPLTTTSLVYGQDLQIRCPIMEVAIQFGLFKWD